MNADIMQLSNNLVYDHRLVVGSSAVARQSLQPARLTEVRQSSQHPPWVCEVLDHERRVILLDTDALGLSLEATSSTGVCNPTEAAVACQLVDALGDAGCSMD